MPARLILEEGGSRAEYPLASSVTLGRGKECQIVLRNRILSRAHARIEASLGKDGRIELTLHDLGSRNGTYLNGRKVEGPSVLRDGDRIRLGPFTLRLHEQGPPLRPIPAGPFAAPARVGLLFGFILLAVFAAAAWGSRTVITRLLAQPAERRDVQ